MRRRILNIINIINQLVMIIIYPVLERVGGDQDNQKRYHILKGCFPIIRKDNLNDNKNKNYE